MNRFALRLLSGLIVLLASAASLPAQSKPAADASGAAYDIYSTGSYQAAAAAYEKLLKDFPTDGVVPSAQVQLAFTYYFLGQYDQALAILAKANSGPPLPPELKQIADGLLPQILSSKAAAMPATDPKRTAAFEDAIKKFTDFIGKYPQAPDLENTIFSRAIASYQIQKFDNVVKDLELNIQRFPQSSTLASSKNLLALTLATQGSAELSKGDAADTARAFALYKRSLDLLREIISKKDDIALINEANFQLGQILLNQAASSPEPARAPLYQEALAAFRDVAPQEEILALQQTKLKEFPERKREALLAKDNNLLKQLNRDNERELKKLADLQSKPDQTATALLKMAEIFFQQGDNNAARVVLNHVTPFLTSEEDKKRLAYFKTMTYALQNAADRAPANYTQFQAKYKGDPLADNLPVVMGNMFLGVNNPTEAIRYFDESLALYPSGRFAGLSVVSKASAESRLGKMQDAMKTFQSFLAKNPPPEIGVLAQVGLAGIYKDTQKWDDAIAAYKVVKDTYPSTASALEADYWIALCTQQKGDNAATIPLLDAFVKANPKSQFAPLALYLKGGAQIALEQKAEGIITLAAVADQYPDSQPAPFTYFLRAQLLSGQGKTSDAIALWRKFVEKYPKDDKVYFAYQNIAQTAANSSNTDEAVAAYREFEQKYPESPQAGEAMFKIAEIQRVKADSLGRYGALTEEERAQWRASLEASIATSEELIKKYPDSPSVALDLQVLLQSQRMLMAAELKKASEVEPYFQALADSAPTPNAKSKILFALANYVSEQDKARALTIMTAAYNPEIVYSPQDLDFFGLALLGQKKTDEAAAIFEKLARDYPIPPGATAAQTSASVQEGQATALFGKGQVAQARGQTAEAGKFFEQLKALYPWSPKVFEANYGIAQSMRQEGKIDDSIALLGTIIREKNASPELRANSSLLGGNLMLDKMKAAPDQKAKDEFQAAAIDYFMKIAQFYGGVPLPAAEGLWQGGQLLEQQAATTTDPKIDKAKQLKNAKGAYQQLLKDYPNSEFAAKAQARLTTLGGQ